MINKFKLNPQQKSAAEAPQLPLLIIAGAGTGKTQTLTGRLIHLLNFGIAPEKICAITFTNKATAEMRERISNIQLPISPATASKTFWTAGSSRRRDNHQLPFIGTFHSLGAKILRSEARFFKRTRGFTIFDDDDSFSLVKKIYKVLIGNKENQKQSLGPAFFATKISDIKNGALKIEGLKNSSEPVDRWVVKFFENYEGELEKNNAFDFDDLIEKVVKIFREQPAVLKKYQQHFPYVLIDEYQDLNGKQYELIKLLAGNSQKLTVVGDDQQMIYGWRYADLDIFLNFENDWPEAQVALLEENYRSTQNIIAAASALIQNNKYQRTKNLWTKNPSGELIKIIETPNEESEAERIAEQIDSGFKNDELRINSENKNLLNQASKFIIPSTAVLYRTNAQSRALEQSLLEKNIPYRIFGGVKFYERREIKDILAALRFVFNPADQISRERLEKNISKGRFSEFQGIVSENKPTNPLRLINIFLKASDYSQYLERNFLNAAERLENIEELRRWAARFEDLSSFLEQMALVQQTDNIGANRQALSDSRFAVNLMTIHLAKGLEFDRVFVAGCSEGILPHSRSLGEEKELEEERRLMYVAMTRAKKELFLSFYDLPSRFLSELPGELIQFESLISDGKVFTDDEERYITLD